MNRIKQKGFTLAELIVGFAVFSLMMALVSFILRGGENQLRVSDIKMNIQESARECLYKMSQEIRESSSNRISISGGNSVLTFQIPSSVSNSGAITWSNPITYQVGGNGSQLIRLDTATQQTTVLANDIRTVAFTLNGNPPASLNLSVTAQRTLPNGRILTQAATGEAKLRNP